jgi:hypothetical protein
MCNPDDVPKTDAVRSVMIMKDAGLVLKGLAQRHLEVSCAMLISQAFMRAGQHRQV